MALVWLIWYTFRYVFFKFAICLIALMNLGETCHLKSSDMVTGWRTMLLLCCYHCDRIMTSRSLKTYCDVTQCMTGLWIFITKLESPKGDSQTWSSPPRNNGACVIINLKIMFWYFPFWNPFHQAKLHSINYKPVWKWYCHDKPNLEITGSYAFWDKPHLWGFIKSCCPCKLAGHVYTAVYMHKLWIFSIHVTYRKSYCLTSM